MLRAVTFDFWNTLMVEERGRLRGHRLEAWAGILESVGFAVERQRLDAVFDISWQRFVEAWGANEQYQAAHAAEHMLEELGFDVPDDVRVALIDSFTDAGATSELHPTPNVDVALRELRDAGVKLGIICDVGMTPSTVLRAQLQRCGLLEHFDHWSFSDEVGVYKPSPRIFDHALEGLGGIEPGDAAHIGDLRRTDIAGAKAMGMTSVRYNGVFDDDDPSSGPEADLVVTDHALTAKTLLAR